MESKLLAAQALDVGGIVLCGASGVRADATNGGESRERPEAFKAGALSGIEWMTLKDFADMSNGCGIRPSQMWAELERDPKPGPSMSLV